MWLLIRATILGTPRERAKREATVRCGTHASHTPNGHCSYGTCQCKRLRHRPLMRGVWHVGANWICEIIAFVVDRR
jgi:hypothetical protein